MNYSVIEGCIRQSTQNPIKQDNMTYIWNRADRVPKELMPDAIKEAFRKWTKEQYKDFNKLTEEEKNQVNYKVCVQMGKMNFNLKQLGYIK
jgi:hypothetical protein